MTQYDKIRELQNTVYQAPILPSCKKHEQLLGVLQSTWICVRPSCKDYLQSMCRQCKHPSSHLQEIRHVVPQLSQALQKKWSEISSQNSEIESMWGTCQVNVNYCLDILNQLYKIIQDSKASRVHDLPIFEAVLDQVLGLRKHERPNTYEEIKRVIEQLNRKYGVFEDGSISTDCIDKDILFRKQKWTKIGHKTKKFSEKALAFSETLAQQIQDRIKYEKRKQKMNQITANKVATLKDLLQFQADRLDDSSLASKMEELSYLKIQLPSNVSQSKSVNSSGYLKSKEDNSSLLLQNNLEKCENLTCVLINNKNGRISKKLWQVVVDKFQILKKLKQLRLNIRMEDLVFLTNLFKQKHNAVRHIPILHLTITDEPKLDMKKVAEFCNTLQLRELYLCLTRDNINKTGFVEFTNVLRFKTSLSFLPLNVFEANLSKNKISEIDEKLFCENLFNQKYKEVKKKTISF